MLPFSIFFIFKFHIQIEYNSEYWARQCSFKILQNLILKNYWVSMPCYRTSSTAAVEGDWGRWYVRNNFLVHNFPTLLLSNINLYILLPIWFGHKRLSSLTHSLYSFFFYCTRPHVTAIKPSIINIFIFHLDQSIFHNFSIINCCCWCDPIKRTILRLARLIYF